MSRSRLQRAAVVALALVIVAAGTAAAAVPGDPLKLGVANTINALTAWRGTVAGRLIALQNLSSEAAARVFTAVSSGGSSTIYVENTGSGPGIQVKVTEGRAPLLVNATAGKATNLNADKLDGKDASAFLLTTGKAADADKLDGIDSGGFVKGSGTLVASKAIAAVVASTGNVLTVPGAGTVRYTCNGTSLYFDFYNDTSGYMFLIQDDGGTDPSWAGRLNPSTATTATPAKSADHVVYHLFPTDSSVTIVGTVVTIEVSGFVEFGTVCDMWAQAFVVS
jgi:hypothetical protein